MLHLAARVLAHCEKAIKARPGRTSLGCKPSCRALAPPAAAASACVTRIRSCKQAAQLQAQPPARPPLRQSRVSDARHWRAAAASPAGRMVPSCNVRRGCCASAAHNGRQHVVLIDHATEALWRPCVWVVRTEFKRRTSSLQCDCHASAAQRRQSVLPVPVGLSSSAFLPCKRMAAQSRASKHRNAGSKPSHPLMSGGRGCGALRTGQCTAHAQINERTSCICGMPRLQLRCTAGPHKAPQRCEMPDVAPLAAPG